MSNMKLGVILLVFLLAAMAMVPCVSAAEICQDKGVQADNDVEFVDLGNSINLFDEFGLQKPADPEISVPFRTYADSKDAADTIMKAAKLSDASDSVIGMYVFGNHQILLINQADTILAVSYDGNNVKTSTIVPRLLGEKKITGTPKLIWKTGDTVTTNEHIMLYSSDIVIPESDSMVLTLYTVTVTRTDQYKNVLGEIRASLTVKGKFYVNYGSSITGITDLSSYYTTYPYTTCEYSHYTSGAGTTAGQVNAHLKTGAAFARARMDNWVSCDAWLSTNDGGSTSTWMSGNGDGCTG